MNKYAAFLDELEKLSGPAGEVVDEVIKNKKLRQLVRDATAEDIKKLRNFLRKNKNEYRTPDMYMDAGSKINLPSKSGSKIVDMIIAAPQRGGSAKVNMKYTDNGDKLKKVISTKNFDDLDNMPMSRFLHSDHNLK